MALKKTLKVLNELAIEIYGQDVLVDAFSKEDCAIYLNSEAAMPIVQITDQHAAYMMIAVLREKKKLIKNPLDSYDFINA